MAKNLKPGLPILLVLIMAWSIILAAKARPLSDAKDLNSTAGKETKTIFGALHVVEAKTAVLSSAGKVSVQGNSDESVPSPGVGH